MKNLILVAILFLCGCAGMPPIEIPIQEEYLRTDFQVSQNNKYAILMQHHIFASALSENPFDKVEIEDPYIANDLDQMRRLLTNKGYDVYEPPTFLTLWETIGAIKEHSNSETQLFFFYSGEGDGVGLRTTGMRVGSQLIIPPNVTIKPVDLFLALRAVNGRKAVLLNACESGIFVDLMLEMEETLHPGLKVFNGVIIAACADGCSTTPYEWWGTTAIVSGFLRLYEDDPSRVVDLAEVELELGSWWYNFMHHVQFSHPRLRLSYDPVIYRGVSFPF